MCKSSKLKLEVTYNENTTGEVEVEIEPSKCTGNEIVTIERLGKINSYKGDFPSPFQVMNYWSTAKGLKNGHAFYVDDTTIRTWIKDAAKYHCIPHVMLAVILQQENGPKATRLQKFLQFAERQITTILAYNDELLFDIIPDKIADGSSGFLNMRRPTLKGAINYYRKNYNKELMPDEVKTRVLNINVDRGIPGFDWRADLYYGAAHIRELIDRLVGRCANRAITMEEVEKIFASYNGSGKVAAKYGRDAIELLKGAINSDSILYFYEE